MDYKVMPEAEDFFELRKKGKMEQLFCNGIVSRSCSHYDSTKFLKTKKNVCFRLMMYAFFDCLDDDSNCIKSKLEQKIKNNYLFYCERVLFVCEKKYHPEFYVKVFENLKKWENKIYQSDFSRFYHQFENIFFNIVVTNSISSGHTLHYLNLTTLGKEVKNMVDLGYLF